MALPPSRRLLRRVYRWTVDRLPMRWRRAVRYRRVHGHFPALRHPVHFTEKVTWRMLNDRRELLHRTCDKLAMKEHASRTAPAGVRVPRTLWSGTDVGELAAVALTGDWVLKPNHRTGLVLFGSGPADVVALEAATQGWLLPEEWLKGGEWAYSVARACLLVEERIGAPGTELTDYKFFVFDGRVRAVQTYAARFSASAMRLYSAEWEYLGRARDHSPGDPVPRPARLEEMIAAAEQIGAGYDFIRVDLYEHDEEVWFGELTPYPGSGLVAWESTALDRRVGSWWTLPR